MNSKSSDSTSAREDAHKEESDSTGAREDAHKEESDSAGAGEDAHKEENRKRDWQSEPRSIGEEKMVKMGIECETCGRPYDETFFTRRITQLAQRRGEMEWPDQPKVRVHHKPLNYGTAYQWEVIHKLEEKVKALKEKLGVKELEFETKTNAEDGSEEKEEEEKN